MWSSQASGGGEGALEGWNLGGVDQPWRNPARSAAAGSVVTRGKKRKSSEEKWFGSSFIGVHCFVEERERESSQGAGLRSAGGAGVPFGCVAVARHRWPDVAGRREASGGGAGGGRGRRRHVGEVRAAQACNGSGSGRRRWITCARQRQRRSGTRGRRRGPICKTSKVQGPHCNALITFKPVLNLRWAQKQKCRVFQNVQLFFKVHSQKS
jgi:hypothetical protein